MKLYIYKKQDLKKIGHLELSNPKQAIEGFIRDNPSILEEYEYQIEGETAFVRA